MVVAHLLLTWACKLHILNVVKWRLLDDMFHVIGTWIRQLLHTHTIHCITETHNRHVSHKQLECESAAKNSLPVKLWDLSHSFDSFRRDLKNFSVLFSLVYTAHTMHQRLCNYVLYKSATDSDNDMVTPLVTSKKLLYIMLILYWGGWAYHLDI